MTLEILTPISSGGDVPVTSLPAGGTISSSGYFDNVGAAGLAPFVMAATEGLSVTIKRVDSFEITVAPAAGKQIYWTGSPGGMTANEFLRLTADGDLLHLVVDANGDAQVTQEVGSLLEETP